MRQHPRVRVPSVEVLTKAWDSGRGFRFLLFVESISCEDEEDDDDEEEEDEDEDEDEDGA